MIRDAAFFDRLRLLKLRARDKSSMNMSGGRKSTKKGSSAEFSDFREYMPGDEVKRIDWNAYARLDRLFIKEYMEEREMTVSILLDTSASMEYGENKKSELARNLAAALSYVSISNMDRVVLYDIKHMERPFSISGGRRNFPVLSEYIDKLDFSGEASMKEAIRLMNFSGPGITIIISDFLLPEFFEEEDNLTYILKYLNYKKQSVILLHTLAEEELDITYTGTVNLIDMENDRKIKVTMDSQSISTYEKELQKFLSRIKMNAKKYQDSYVLCNTKDDIYKILFEDLREVYDI